jgi:hypothetical protein
MGILKARGRGAKHFMGKRKDLWKSAKTFTLSRPVSHSLFWTTKEQSVK